MDLAGILKEICDGTKFFFMILFAHFMVFFFFFFFACCRSALAMLYRSELWFPRVVIELCDCMYSYVPDRRHAFFPDSGREGGLSFDVDVQSWTRADGRVTWCGEV